MAERYCVSELAIEGGVPVRSAMLPYGRQQVTDEDDELMLISAGGQVIRTETNSINRYSAQARGVIVMRLGDGDTVAAIAAFRLGLAERGAMGDNDDPVPADGASTDGGTERS